MKSIIQQEKTYRSIIGQEKIYKVKRYLNISIYEYNYLLTEGGDYLLTESGEYLLTEN